ncbi:phosphate transporter PHO1-1 [Selaginella moellendorffii]|uniref:phosphate transporter PHO1-1 n=1 Tax=Selaginella moellendorffii TaxID=88036 RepID=UPI000D1CCCDC|nr:phosphate transporter PHO1-1 [Selaginella moellendorffii]|eukprot:XP_024522602.1 phosphate transporter PHO1-1 [Selaginella moellendorffii]
MAFWKITKKFDKLLDTMDQVNSIVKHTFIKGWACDGELPGIACSLRAATYSFSTLALFVLHLCMYACNVYFWQRARIHYASMLEMAPGADLKHQDIFLISLALAAILLLGMVLYLGADILAIQAVTTNDMPLLVIVVSEAVILRKQWIQVVVALLVIPYNYFYKPARYGLLRLIARTIFSPLSEVRLHPSLRLQLSRILAFPCATMEAVFWLATLQSASLLHISCLRKWHDGDQVQLANAAKYLCGMLSLMAKFAYARTGSTLWFVSFIVISLCTTMYQLYWDLVMDWGLLQRRSRNPWLRDELILTKKAIYIASMVVNSFLRFAWLHSFLSFRAGTDQQVVQFMFAFLEVLRRGLWNFFR